MQIPKIEFDPYMEKLLKRAHNNHVDKKDLTIEKNFNEVPK